MTRKPSSRKGANLNPPNDKGSILRVKFKRSLFGIGVALTTALIVLILLLFHHSVVPVHADSAAAQRVQAKVEQARTAASSGQPQELSLDQDELNSLIESRLASTRRSANAESGVRELQLQLVNDHIGVHLVLEVYGRAMTVDISGTLRTRDGYLEFDPLTGKIGAIPLPEAALKEAVRQALSTPSSRQDMKLPANIRDLRVAGSRLVATYR